VIFGFLLRMHMAALSCREPRYRAIRDVAGDDQSVIFTPYVADAYAMQAYFGENRCVMVTGRELKDRATNVDLFRTGQRQYCICTMASGSTGLDGLQVASKLFFAAHSWKWSERRQSIGRIARMGQQNEAKVYDVVLGIGICHKILANLGRKTGLIEEVRGIMNRVEDLRRFARAL
jgi:SNF2 family DNA or RNA helicase